MLIHELTKPKNEQLDEVVGGLARMAGQAIAQSPVGQAVGRAVDATKQGGIAQALQKIGDVEQTAQIQGQTQALSQAALKQWNNRVMQLMQASGGQPVDETEYHDHLKDFVERTMLSNRSIDNLDQNSQTRLDSAIDAVMTNRGDTRKLQTAFQQLAGAALVSRDDPAKTRQAAAQPGQAQMTPQQATTAIKTALQRNIGAGGTQALATVLKQVAGTNAVRSTGNPATDSLLNTLGIRTS